MRLSYWRSDVFSSALPSGQAEIRGWACDPCKPRDQRGRRSSQSVGDRLRNRPGQAAQQSRSRRRCNPSSGSNKYQQGRPYLAGEVRSGVEYLFKRCGDSSRCVGSAEPELGHILSEVVTALNARVDPSRDRRSAPQKRQVTLKGQELETLFERSTERQVRQDVAEGQRITGRGT